jgi:sensor domain CHASE-containing protein
MTFSHHKEQATMAAQLNTLITLSVILPIVFGIGITVIVLVWVRKFMHNMIGANLKDGMPAQATILRIWQEMSTLLPGDVIE